MEFNYDKKENYSQADLDAILTQHTGFETKKFKGYVSAEDHDKVLKELKPYRNTARTEKLTGLLPKTANKELSKDIIQLTKLTEDATDEQITAAFEETISSRKYLQAEVIDDPAAAKRKAFKTIDELKAKDSTKDKELEEKFGDL